jgi:hypothetical protein
MAKALTHITVPKFSASHLALAEVCATELWNGIDYQTGKELEFSDEDLLVMFATPTFAMYNSTSTKQTITELDIRSLIRIAKLKALFRSEQPTDFQGAIAAYRASALAIYSGWKKNTLKLANPYDYATQAIRDWSVKFVNNTGVSPNGNHRVPLACRILFFAMPDMMVFNFSNGLAIKKMCLQSRPQAAIPCFNKYLYEGLQLNNVLLTNLNMPKPTALSEDIWISAKNGDWWQRRVLDLALLLHFGLASATPQLQTKGRQLAARWAAKKATP